METLALISDMQCPQQDDRAIKVALKLISHIKPTRACHLGDVIAADSVSRYDKKTWNEARRTLKSEIAITNKVLDQFDAVFKEIKCREVDFLEGNHEQRIIKWVLKNAMSLGDMDELDIRSMLKIKERGYNYIEIKDQPLTINKFNLIHGWYVNQYHASKTLRMTGRNTFYGHSHDWQVHASSHYEGEPPRIAMSCGCLCDYRQDFLSGRPTNWMHGLTIIYYNDNGFTPLFIPIVNYQAIWNGKVFKA